MAPGVWRERSGLENRNLRKKRAWFCWIDWLKSCQKKVGREEWFFFKGTPRERNHGNFPSIKTTQNFSTLDLNPHPPPKFISSQFRCSSKVSFGLLFVLLCFALFLFFFCTKSRVGKNKNRMIFGGVVVGGN